MTWYLLRGTAPQLRHERVGHVHYVLGPPHHGNSHRGLLKELGELGQLGFALAAGQYLLGHIVGKYGDAGRLAVLLEALVGKIKVVGFSRLTAGLLHHEWHLYPKVGFARFVHAVEQGNEALTFGFGSHLGHASASLRPAHKELLISGIVVFDTMLRSPKYHNYGRCFLKNLV